MQDVNLEKKEAEVEDDDNGDTYDVWDITVKDVERIRQFLMPNVPNEMDEVLQPLIPQPIHTTSPNDDYVAPDTKSILDELLKEFRDEIVNVTMIDEEAAKDPQSYFTKIQVHSVITKPEPFIHTRSLSPLCGVFKTSKPCKNPTVQNWYGTPRESLFESGEAMSARRSKQQPKGRRRNLWHGKHDYCIMKEGMSTLRGRKSVPGISSSKREMERK
nr:hypothetical protein [Tanacetum cinerariifolium]